jgi:hypothetical protein
MRHFIAVTLLVTFSAFAQEPPPAQPPAKKPPTRSGEVYKWVDANGVIHYTDKPPKENAQPARLPPLQTYREGTLPDLKKFDKAAGKPITNVGPQLQVVTPSSEEVFRGGERTVPVAVVVTPPLSGDQRLVYMLDDKPQPHEHFVRVHRGRSRHPYRIGGRRRRHRRRDVAVAVRDLLRDAADCQEALTH